ncbi:hypothetical protein [Algiphilus sp.]|uniref:hypothetical protein n=1 Tax=Algiphilus sp. TaxID=1872431 RepID=UPI003C5C8B90
MASRDLTSRSKAQLIEQLEAEYESMRRQRQAARLAASLMAEWHINPEGIDLVCWLADPNTPSNAEALRSWVVLQMADPDFVQRAEYEFEIAILRERLRERLMQFERSFA